MDIGAPRKLHCIPFLSPSSSTQNPLLHQSAFQLHAFPLARAHRLFTPMHVRAPFSQPQAASPFTSLWISISHLPNHYSCPFHTFFTHVCELSVSLISFHWLASANRRTHHQDGLEPLRPFLAWHLLRKAEWRIGRIGRISLNSTRRILCRAVRTGRFFFLPLLRFLQAHVLAFSRGYFCFSAN